MDIKGVQDLLAELKSADVIQIDQEKLDEFVRALPANKSGAEIMRTVQLLSKALPHVGICGVFTFGGGQVKIEFSKQCT